MLFYKTSAFDIKKVIDKGSNGPLVYMEHEDIDTVSVAGNQFVKTRHPIVFKDEGQFHLIAGTLPTVPGQFKVRILSKPQLKLCRIHKADERIV